MAGAEYGTVIAALSHFIYATRNATLKGGSCHDIPVVGFEMLN